MLAGKVLSIRCDVLPRTGQSPAVGLADVMKDLGAFAPSINCVSAINV